MKILVVGYGSIGKRHITNLSTIPKLEILVCTRRKNDKFLKQKKCKIFRSLADAINEKPDAALITNVTNLHVQTAIKLANAKIDFFIEKPLSDSTKGITDLLKTVQKHKILTYVGCNLRFHPCIKMLKEIISKKELGRIISIHVENGSYLPDWHPYEDYKKSYAARNDMGGGASLTCIHELDYVYWFFGNPIEIFSFTGKFSDLGISADDLSTILMKFKNKCIAEVHLDYFQRPAFRSCKIIGTKGTAYWNSETNSVRVYDIETKKWTTRLKQKHYDVNLTYVDEINYFINSVKKRKKMHNDIKEDINVLTIALTAKKSSKDKKVVALA